jgi:hypothetical protein
MVSKPRVNTYIQSAVLSLQDVILFRKQQYELRIQGIKEQD